VPSPIFDSSKKLSKVKLLFWHFSLGYFKIVTLEFSELAE
jgi:hypothetical protein